MDLVLLVAPSLLFALLQYKSSVHSQEVKLIQENLEKFLCACSVEEKALSNENRLKKNLDAVRAVKPKSIREMLFRAFVAYLLLISVAHCTIALGWKISDINFLHLIGSDKTDFLLTVHSIFSIYMVILAGAACFQIWEISQEKKKVAKANAEAEGQIELLQSYKIGLSGKNG